MLKVINKYKNLPITVKTSLIYVICNILQKGIAFIAVPIYTRIVPSEQYGLYSLYQSWDSILSIFLTLQMWSYSYSKGMIKYEGNKDKFTTSLCGLSFVLTTVGLLIYTIFRKKFLFFSGLTYSIMLLMFLDIYLRPSFEYWCARQRFEYDVKKYAIVGVVLAVITPIISIFLVWLLKEEKGTALVAGKVLSAAPFYLAVFINILKRNRRIYDKDIWRYALSFSLPLIPHFLSTVILAQSDRIMIGRMCNHSDVAIYSVAYSIAAVMLIFNSAIMDSIIPWTYQHLRKKDIRNLPWISNLSLLIISLLNIAIILVAPELVAIVAPSEYYKAVYVIPPVAASNVFIFMFNLFANIEYFYEKTYFVSIASCIAAATNIILNFIFIRRFGFVAAGYTTLICYIIYALAHYVFMKHISKKKFNEPIYKSTSLWTISFATVGLSIGIIYLYKYFAIRLILLFILIYFACIKAKKYYSVFALIRKEGRKS